MLARQDFYGEGLAESASRTHQGRWRQRRRQGALQRRRDNFTAEVNEIAAAKPDAIILVAFDETTKIIPQLIAKGIGPTGRQDYFVDGNTADYTKDFRRAPSTGVKATYPAPPLTRTSRTLLEVDPKLKDFTYGPESYDATIMSALAAIAAKGRHGEAIATEIIKVSKDGTEVHVATRSARSCSRTARTSTTTVSRVPCDMNDTGSLSKATIGIFQYDANNTYKNVDYVTGVVE